VDRSFSIEPFEHNLCDERGERVRACIAGYNGC
jgi:hypothetical protein